MEIISTVSLFVSNIFSDIMSKRSIHEVEQEGAGGTVDGAIDHGTNVTGAQTAGTDGLVTGGVPTGTGGQTAQTGTVGMDGLVNGGVPTSTGEYIQGISFNLQGEFPHAQPGQIPSVHNTVGSHVSASLKEKIMAGQYVDFECLFDPNSNVIDESKLSINKDGELVLKQAQHKQRIGNVEVWTDAFVIFSSIYLMAHPDQAQSLLKYMHTIRTGAKRHVGIGWKNYDIQFRLRLASDPNSRSFDTIDYELWLMYMASNPLSVQNTSLPTGYGPVTSKLKCYDYNFRQCMKGNCKYTHLCLNCNNPHPYRYCVRNREFRGQHRFTWRATGSQGQPRTQFNPRFLGQNSRFAK